MKNTIKPWIILVCCCGLAASSIGCVVNTVGVFYTPVSESLGVLRGTFALSATFMLLATAFTSLMVPKLMKTINFKLIILIGVLLASVPTILMGLTNNMILFYLWGALKGIGSGLYNILLITTIINNWFQEKNGIATSIVLSFSGIIGAVMSPVLTSLINSVGWEMTYIILGIVTFAFVLPSLLYPFALHPHQENMLPYGASENIEVMLEDKEVIFKPLQLNFMLYLLVAIMLTAITGLTSHFPGYAQSIEISAATGALMLSAGMVGNIVSKMIIGILCDVIGSIKAVIVMVVANMIAIVGLLFFRSEYALVATSVLFGSIYSLGAVGIAIMTRYFFGNDCYVKAYSYVSFASNIGSAVALSIIGFIYDIFRSYAIAFYGAFLFNVITLIIIFYLEKQTKVKRL